MNANPANADEIRRYEEQYSLNPESLVFARLADAYRKAGQAERALALLEHGLARHSDYVSAHIVRARAFADLGRRAEAARAFEQVLRFDAGNVIALRSLADLALQDRDHEAARRWLGRLVQVDPLNEEAKSELGGLVAQDAEPVPEHGAEPSAPALDRESVETPPATSQDLPVVEPGAAVSAATRAQEVAWWKEPTPDTLSTPEAGGSPWRDLWERDPEPPPEENGDEGDLLTRTMAELYARQGLYREAAEIYEELLRLRPDDEELGRLLEETRWLGRPAAASVVRKSRAAGSAGGLEAGSGSPADPHRTGPDDLQS